MPATANSHHGPVRGEFTQPNLLNTIEKDSTWRLISGTAGIKIPVSEQSIPGMVINR